MELLRKSITVLFIVIAVQSFAQESKTVQAAFSKSFVYESKKLYDDAIKSLKEVYEEKSYPMNIRLGWLYYLDKNYATSITYYQKAADLMPVATEPLWAILNPQTALEKWVDAEKTYLSILKLDPKNSSANFKLGMIYYYRKNFTTAKKYFDVSLNLYPIDYDSMIMSGWNNYFLGNAAEAKILFNKVLLLYPTDTSAKEALGLIK
jgi:tetratricopeptide (TPR) repeat protein